MGEGENGSAVVDLSRQRTLFLSPDALSDVTTDIRRHCAAITSVLCRRVCSTRGVLFKNIRRLRMFFFRLFKTRFAPSQGTAA